MIVAAIGRHPLPHMSIANHNVVPFPGPHTFFLKEKNQKLISMPFKQKEKKGKGGRGKETETKQ